MALLELPGEIRDQILDECLCSRAETPTTPATTVHDRKAHRIYKQVIFKNMQNPALPVLLVNRQLHDEMKLAVSRRSSRRASYAIDIMYVKTSGLWPTWVSAPVLATDLDTVHATFRLFNPPDNLPEHMSSSLLWGQSDGTRAAGVWVFYHMITEFINRQIGPWPRRGETEAGEITVQQLIMDVLTPTEPEIIPLSEAKGYNGQLQDCYMYPYNRDGSPKTPAEAFTDFIKEEIDGLIYMNSRGRVDCGKILYERFGSIEIRIDGRLNHSWDVSKFFAQVPLSDPWGSSWDAEVGKTKLREWKVKTAEKRQKAGFKVVEEDETRRWWE